MSDLAAAWPAGLPFVCLSQGGRFQIVPTHFREVTWSELAAVSVVKPSLDGEPMHHGYVGVISYDQYADDQTCWPNDAASMAKSRILSVDSALVYDRTESVLYVPRQTETRHPGDTWVDAGAVAERLTVQADPSEPHCPSLDLEATSPDGAYEAQVDRVISDIQAGRYYQLNLLRYFRFSKQLSRGDLLRRMDLCGGAMSCYFELPDLTLLSLSPERFITIRSGLRGAKIGAFPIKGTAPRHDGDLQADRRAASTLRDSAKDRAELAMIVDLMRNDLNQICQPGTVQVRHHASLMAARGVHHLYSEIEGNLALPLSWGQLLGKLCPAGSITGAPKREVMQAIAQYEGRKRGYFMGHAFTLDQNGNFDSSVLIRTLVRHDHDYFEYAAGSGLVIGSDAVAERLEIAAKCRVATNSAKRENGSIYKSRSQGLEHGYQENL